MPVNNKTGKFILRKDAKHNAFGEQPVYLQYSCSGQAVRKVTEVWVHPDDWSGDVSKPIKSSNPRAAQLNSQLLKFKHKYDDVLLNLPDNMVITPKLIRAIFNGSYFKKQKDEEGAIDFVEYVIKLNKALYDNGKVSYSIWVNVQCSMRKFKEFLRKCHYGDILCCEVTSDLINAYKDWRRDELGNTNETINKALTPIFKTVTDITSRGWISRTEFGTMNDYLPPTRKSIDDSDDSSIHFLTEDQLTQLKGFYSTCKYDRTKDFIDIFFFSVYACGLRLSDLLTLQWSNVDLEKKLIRKTMIKGHTKRNTELIIPLTANSISILEKWIGRSNRFVFALLPDDIDLNDEEVLRTEIQSKGKAFQISLKHLGETMKLPFSLTPHVARHTFATMALNRGVDIHKIASLLGHASSFVTERVYAKFLPSTLQAEVDEKLNFKF